MSVYTRLKTVPSTTLGRPRGYGGGRGVYDKLKDVPSTTLPPPTGGQSSIDKAVSDHNRWAADGVADRAAALRKQQADDAAAAQRRQLASHVKQQSQLDQSRARSGGGGNAKRGRRLLQFIGYTNGRAKMG
ncbi:hypothetical protein PUV47_01970 [Pseudovibrio exalbescens]|uniref:hypothetical protein n=1 Tax=Pseudovibrio exalbescens TaxID=197461 RepID=UPI0023655DF1|nr:hypothetical protein [Pseudovibrio exalbescens]MDD7908671.1 hypothetical protein [Pseudovibrio exalbescens]